MTTYAYTLNKLLPIPAQIVGERLEHIRVQNDGHLQPEMVVTDARPEESVLHPAFEWNDEVAAEQWRVEQARSMIRSVTVVPVEESDTPSRPVRAFVSVKREDDRSYTSIAHAMSDAELRAQVLAKAVAEIQGWRERYKDLQELAQIYAAIDQTQEKLNAA